MYKVLLEAIRRTGISNVFCEIFNPKITLKSNSYGEIFEKKDSLNDLFNSCHQNGDLISFWRRKKWQRVALQRPGFMFKLEVSNQE